MVSAAAGPIFAVPIVNAIDLVILVFALVIEVAAFGHCLVQRSEAFPAIGTLPKGAWLALTGGGALLTATFFGWQGIFGLIGIIAAAVYLLDVRPAVRDLADGSGSGPW